MRPAHCSESAEKRRVHFASRRKTAVPLLFRVSEGRGRSSIVKGRIVATFPAVFTVRTESGEVRTFSYSAVHTREVLLLPDDKG